MSVLHTLACDVEGCATVFVGSFADADQAELRSEAEAHGWDYIEADDFCPEHVRHRRAD